MLLFLDNVCWWGGLSHHSVPWGENLSAGQNQLSPSKGNLSWDVSHECSSHRKCRIVRRMLMKVKEIGRNTDFQGWSGGFAPAKDHVCWSCHPITAVELTLWFHGWKGLNAVMIKVSLTLDNHEAKWLLFYLKVISKLPHVSSFLFFNCAESLHKLLSSQSIRS